MHREHEGNDPARAAHSRERTPSPDPRRRNGSSNSHSGDTGDRPPVEAEYVGVFVDERDGWGWLTLWMDPQDAEPVAVVGLCPTSARRIAKSLNEWADAA